MQRALQGFGWETVQEAEDAEHGARIRGAYGTSMLNPRIVPHWSLPGVPGSLVGNLPGGEMPDHAQRNLQTGLRVSQVSLAWTIAAGTVAIVVGVMGSSLALTTFGLIGLLDGIGSASLIVHFRHSRRHQAISERHEQIALMIVTVGMATIGLATIGESIYRLVNHAASHPLAFGSVMAAASIFILGTLALSKRRIAQRIPSHALHSDGWVSGVGALLAFVVLSGTALDVGLGLWWVDSVAAVVIACGAVTLSIVLMLGH